MKFIPNIVIDSAHLIILLSQLNLNPNEKFMLITIDIDAMYPSLQHDDCIRNCISSFSKFKHALPHLKHIKESTIKLVMNLSFQNSFIQFQYNNETLLFSQILGIPMGDNASVSIANITAALELKKHF